MSKQGMRRNLALTLVLAAGSVLWMPAEAAMSGQASCSERASESSLIAGDLASGTNQATAASGAEIQDYAGRQASARGLEEFAGGDHEVVYVGGGTVVLCVILLIIFL